MFEQHRSDLAALWKLAEKDLQTLVFLTRDMSVAEARELLKAGMPDLIDPFLGKASDAAAVLLEELYAITATVPPGTYLPPAERIDRLARWAVGPMVDESLDSTVLTRLVGAGERMFYDAARLTTRDAVISNFFARKNRRRGRATFDEQGRRVAFQRFPRAGACDFCKMLASRGAVYLTRESASQVVGRGSTRVRQAGQSGGIGGGIKKRNQLEIGTQYHDTCRCLVQPVIQGSPIAQYAAETRRKYEAIYRGAAVAADGRVLTEPADMLARWRELQAA